MEQKDKTKELVPEGYYRCEVKKVCTVTGSTNGKEWIRLDLECDIAYGPYRNFFSELHRQKKQIWPNAYSDFKLSYFFNSDGTMQADMSAFYDSLKKEDKTSADITSWVGAEFGVKITIDESGKNVVERIMTYCELVLLPQDTNSEQVKPIFNSSMNTSINNSTLYPPQTNGKQGWNLHTNQRPSTPLYKPSCISPTPQVQLSVKPPPSPTPILPTDVDLMKRAKEIEEREIKVKAELALLIAKKEELLNEISDLAALQVEMYEEKERVERLGEQMQKQGKEIWNRKCELDKRETELLAREAVIVEYGVEVLKNVEFVNKVRDQEKENKIKLAKTEDAIQQRIREIEEREERLDWIASQLKNGHDLTSIYPEIKLTTEQLQQWKQRGR